MYYIHCEKCGPSKAYIEKTKNTLYERFHSSNGHLHPSSKITTLLEHLAQDISPACEFEFENIKILDTCTNDIKLRYMESIYISSWDNRHLIRRSGQFP